MFLHMVPISSESHHARNAQYDIAAYRVIETGEVRVFVSKGALGVGDVFMAKAELVEDSSSDLVEMLIRTAKDDIDRNEFGVY